MAGSNILKTLTRKYADILGALRKSEGDADKLRADLGHLEATIRMFRADWDAGSVAATRPRLPHRWGVYGAGLRTALDVLKDAAGPMTAREIALAVMERQGISTDQRAAVNSAANALSAALKKKIGAGVMGDLGRPRRWWIEP